MYYLSMENRGSQSFSLLELISIEFVDRVIEMFHFHDKILILAPWIHMLYYFAVFSDLFILTTSLTTASFRLS